MATKSGTWRIWLSDLLIAAGGLILLVGALFWTRTALAAGLVDEYRYLPSPLQPSLPLPALYEVEDAARFGLAPVPESPETPADGAPANPGASPEAGAAADPTPVAAAPVEQPPAPAAPTAGVEASPAPPQPGAGGQPPVDPAALALPTGLIPTAVPPTEPPPTPAPTPVPSEGIPPYSPVVRLAIPALDIDRAVVPIGLKPTGGGGLDWDTDRIFATQNRPDLVGQLVGSYSPGQGDNILLIGHNYNQVDWGWAGVFVNIKNLNAGDQIDVFTEDGRKTSYQVVQVKQVPWRNKNASEMEKHMKFMGASDGERVTLITCGGANIWPFPARVYVVATPLGQ